MAVDKWVSHLHLKKGALHRALKVPEDQPIPADKMQEAAHSNSPHMRRMANFAKVSEHFDHGK